MKFTGLLMLFALTFSYASHIPSPDVDMDVGYYKQYERYLQDYNKNYSSSTDYWSHYYNFASNLERIDKHNFKYIENPSEYIVEEYVHRLNFPLVK